MITYRQAKYEDKEELLRLRMEFLGASKSFNAEKKQLVQSQLDQYLSNGMRDGSFIAWVAEESNEMVHPFSASMPILFSRA